MYMSPLSARWAIYQTLITKRCFRGNSVVRDNSCSLDSSQIVQNRFGTFLSILLMAPTIRRYSLKKSTSIGYGLVVLEGLMKKCLFDYGHRRTFQKINSTPVGIRR